MKTTLNIITVLMLMVATQSCNLSRDVERSLYAPRVEVNIIDKSNNILSNTRLQQEDNLYTLPLYFDLWELDRVEVVTNFQDGRTVRKSIYTGYYTTSLWWLELSDQRITFSVEEDRLMQIESIVINIKLSTL